MNDQLIEIDLSKFSSAIISLERQARLLAPVDKIGLEKSPWKELAAAFHGHHTCRFKFSNKTVEGFVSDLHLPVTGNTEFELTITDGV